MFSYKELKIISAVPADDIFGYMREIGASEKTGGLYEYGGLEIEISVYIDNALPELGIIRYLIEARGERSAAEDFLTAFRFRFLSAGG